MANNEKLAIGIKDEDNVLYRFIPPVASDSNVGGIKASPKTTQTQEVKIDPTTNRLYVDDPTDDIVNITGDLTNLHTTNKQNLASAINEVNDSQIGIKKDLSLINEAFNSQFTSTQSVSNKLRSEIMGDFRVQSSCYDTIRNKWILCGNSTSLNGDTKILITSDLVTFSDAESFVVKAGHANDSTFNPDNGYLYICTAYDTTVGKEGDIEGNLVAEIDLDAKAIKRYITISDYTYVSSIEYKDGKYYLGDFGYGSIYDSNFERISTKNVFKWGESIIDEILNIDDTKTGSQGITINGNFLYRLFFLTTANDGWSSNHGVIYRFDLNGKFLGYFIVSPPRIAEPESITFKDGYAYIFHDGSRMLIEKCMLNAQPVQFNVIAENEDLNDYTITGTYYCRNYATQNTHKHTPIDENDASAGYTLFVSPISIDNVEQTIYPNKPNNVKYVRRVIGGTWSDWVAYKYQIRSSESFLTAQAVAADAGKTIAITLPKNNYTDITIEKLRFWFDKSITGLPVPVVALSTPVSIIAGGHTDNIDLSSIASGLSMQIYNSIYGILIYLKFSNAVGDNIQPIGCYCNVKLTQLSYKIYKCETKSE